MKSLSTTMWARCCSPKVVALVAWTSLFIQLALFFSSALAGGRAFALAGGRANEAAIFSGDMAQPSGNVLAALTSRWAASASSSDLSFTSFGKLALVYSTARQGVDKTSQGEYRAGVRYFETAAPTPFWMVLPHAATRVAAANVNTALWEVGRWDGGGSEDQLAAAVFSRHCVTKKKSLVVDIGSNTGWYSALAIAHGCRAITVDGAKDALLYFSATVAMNEWQTSSIILNRVVSNAAPDTFTFDGWNTRPVGGSLDPSAFASQTPERLDTIVGSETVVYLKVDVEGHEPQVFDSGASLFNGNRQQILNVMFEFTYKLFGESLLDQYLAKVWKPLWGAGYSCYILGSTIDPLPMASYGKWAATAQETCKGDHCGVNVWCTLHDKDLANQ